MVWVSAGRTSYPSWHGRAMMPKPPGYTQWTRREFLLICLTFLGEQERGKGGENPRNKRQAELVTLALILHGTLSSHLSHHIEIPCV